MSIPQFDAKDWEAIQKYRDQWENWQRTSAGGVHPSEVNLQEELAFGMIMSSFALLKAQNNLEELEAKVVESQKTVEKFTTLMFYLTGLIALTGILSIATIDVFIKGILELVIIGMIALIYYMVIQEKYSKTQN
jgi:hypothetical protein